MHIHFLKNLSNSPLEVAGVKPSEAAQPLVDALGLGGIVAEMREALKGVQAALRASADRQAEEANNTLQLMKSRKLKLLATENEEVREQLRAVDKEAQARLKEVKTLKTEQEQALAQLNKDLDDFVKHFLPKER